MAFFKQILYLTRGHDVPRGYLWAARTAVHFEAAKTEAAELKADKIAMPSCTEEVSLVEKRKSHKQDIRSSFKITTAKNRNYRTINTICMRGSSAQGIGLIWGSVWLQRGTQWLRSGHNLMTLDIIESARSSGSLNSLFAPRYWAHWHQGDWA